jgi:hypothetical protein
LLFAAPELIARADDAAMNMMTVVQMWLSFVGWIAKSPAT